MRKKTYLVANKANEFVVMETSKSGEDFGGTRSNNCYKCRAVFEDIKSMVQCTLCRNLYHGKCENVDFRGFHMKKSTWRCKQCVDTHGDDRSDSIYTRTMKRSRVDDSDEQGLIEGMKQTLGLLLKTTNELNEKVDQLLQENKYFS